jgi:membrane protein
MTSTRSILRRSRKDRDVLPVRELPGIFFRTTREYMKEYGLYHGAALAYYTLFALVPLLYLCVNGFGKILGKELMYQNIEQLLQKNIGLKDTMEVIEFIKALDFDKGNTWLNVLSIVFLAMASSAFIVCLRRSINDFYDLKPEFFNRKNKIVSNLAFRFLSIVVVTAITLILIVFYFSQSVLFSILEDTLHYNRFWDQLFMSGLEHIFGILSNVIIFSIVFKFVHDGIIRWKLAIWGAVLTSLLLYVGQLLIDYYLNNVFFGARSGGIAGTFFILLAYVYYSSQIIFFGAKFNAVYARAVGKPIRLKTRRKQTRYKRND